jgi:hypothetical protein
MLVGKLSHRFLRDFVAGELNLGLGELSLFSCDLAPESGVFFTGISDWWHDQDLTTVGDVLTELGGGVDWVTPMNVGTFDEEHLAVMETVSCHMNLGKLVLLLRIVFS